jgi:DNA replication protein DnaC
MSTLNPPTITIFGQAKTGKSTIAMLIMKALNDAGIEVRVRNEDTTPEVLAVYQPERLKELVESLQGQAIVIDQIQLRRSV